MDFDAAAVAIERAHESGGRAGEERLPLLRPHVVAVPVFRGHDSLGLQVRLKHRIAPGYNAVVVCTGTVPTSDHIPDAIVVCLPMISAHPTGRAAK